MSAQTEPVTLPNFYSSKIAANGAIIVSEGFDSNEMYEVATGKTTDLGYFKLGQGNCVTTDGSIIVGSTEMDQPIMFVNGREADISSIADVYSYCNFNAITSDGKRIVGLVSNPDLESGSSLMSEDVTMWIPMYIDIKEDGTLGELNYLPYPQKDWTNREPQYVTAQWVSNDGKTILGSVVSCDGYAIYPVLYSQGNDGEWTYSLPTESLINPEKKQIPEYIGEFKLTPPDVKDYMTEAEREAYEAAMQEWIESGYQTEYPEEGYYMTEEEIAAYNEAAEIYNAAAREYNEKFTEYYSVIEELRNESTFFLQNGLTMDAEAKMIALAAEKEIIIDPSDPWGGTEIQHPTITYNVETEEIKHVKAMEDGLFPIPSQILSDGSIIASTPQPSFFSSRQIPPQGFVIPKDGDEYVPFETYLATYDADAAAWLNSNLKKNILVGMEYDEEIEDYIEIYMDLVMTGQLCVSDDWSVTTGGVLAYMFYTDEDLPENDDEELPLLISYVIVSDVSAVNEIDSTVDLDTVKYYDINGFEVNNPEKGIYVVRKVYTDGSVKTSKKAIK